MEKIKRRETMKKTNPFFIVLIAIFTIAFSAANAATYNVINTSDSGAGSLRQAILDANANPGLDNINFAIPLADAGYSNWTGTGDFWWKITLATNLPDITEDLDIDGLSQSTNVADSNPGAVGSGGTVGVDEIALPLYEKLEIEIDANDLTEPIRIAGDASNVLIEGICIFNSGGDAILTRGGTGTGYEIRKCFIGVRADGSEPAAGLKNESAGFRGGYTAGMTTNVTTVDECYIGYNGDSGVIGTRNDEVTPTAPYVGATIIVEYCEAFENGWNSDSQDGIDGNGADNVIRYNLSFCNRSLVDNAGSGGGIETGGYSDLDNLSNNIVENNTCYGNQNHGIVLMRRPTGDEIIKNIVYGNGGPGILVTNRHYFDPIFSIHTYTRYDKITQNSTYDNDGLGIDLCNVEWDDYLNGDEVTFNNDAKIDINANEDMDFPVITEALLTGNSLSLTGYIGTTPGQVLFADSRVEFFISSFDGVINPNPIVTNDVYPYHGEGKTYLGFLTSDASGNFAGILDVTGFGLGAGDWLTSTATDPVENTSEFGENKEIDIPTPVVLSSFAANYVDGSPNIIWSTQSETNNIGWNIYRGENDEDFQDDLVIRINNLMIPGSGTTSSPTDYNYQDEYDVIENNTYWYWLESRASSGETTIYGPITLTIPNSEDEDFFPNTLLYNNFPNPLTNTNNFTTTIGFEIKEGETAKLSIFNAKGQLIETRNFTTGMYNETWDASDYSSGIYFYKLESKSYLNTKRMLLIK